MSGGSWDYVYGKFEDVADRLIADTNPLRIALGYRIKLIAAALHDIEWVDSCDTSPGDENAAIKTALELPPALLSDLAKRLRTAADALDYPE